MKIRKIIMLMLVTMWSFFTAAQPNAYLHQMYLKNGSGEALLHTDNLKKIKRNEIVAGISQLSSQLKAAIIHHTEQVLLQPWPLLTMAQFNEFKLNGNRINYEEHYFFRRRKLGALIIGELVEKKGRYLSEIVTGIGLLMEESTWALPAHMYLQKAGEGLPDTEEPVIDLFVSQTSSLLAWTQFLLLEQLNAYSPLLVKRINMELDRRLFQPYLARNDFWWMGFNERKMNNWNIFINTNTMLSAILANNTGINRTAIIEKTLKSVDRFLAAYAPDGGCEEGPQYWSIAGGALIEYLDLLNFFTKGRFDFSENQFIHSIGTYIYKVHIDKNRYVNFADAAAIVNQQAARVYKYGRLFNDVQMLRFAAYINKTTQNRKNGKFSDLTAFVNEIETGDQLKRYKPEAPYQASSWLPDLQVLTLRQQAGTAQGLFFAAKGGHNGEAHNHNDVGNFVLYKDGNPLIVDAGVGTYTKQTFSPDRYKLWFMQSSWHNCPEINGVAQAAGPAFRATQISYDGDNNQGIRTFSMDLAHAYPMEAGVAVWNRQFIFNSTAKSLVLQEDYTLKFLKKAPQLNFLVYGTVGEEKKGQLLITGYSGHKIILFYNPSAFDFRVERKSIDDQRLAKSWSKDLNRLVLISKTSQLKGGHKLVFVDSL